MLARMLGTKLDNIQAALEKQRDFQDGVAQVASLCKQRRSNGTTQYTSEVVQAWWHNYTRVSSNSKDVVNKGSGSKNRGNTHDPKHYLTITQVHLIHHYEPPLYIMYIL